MEYNTQTSHNERRAADIRLAFVIPLLENQLNCATATARAATRHRGASTV